MDDYNVPEFYRVEVDVDLDSMSVRVLDVNMAPLTGKRSTPIWRSTGHYAFVLDTLPGRMPGHCNVHGCTAVGNHAHVDRRPTEQLGLAINMRTILRCLCATYRNPHYSVAQLERALDRRLVSSDVISIIPIPD